LITTRRHALAAALLAALPLGAVVQTTVLFNSFIPPAHPVNTRIMKPWTDEITKATGGRVKFDMPTSSLAAPPQQMDGVVKGVFDMAYQFHGLMPNARLSQLPQLPGVNSSSRGSSIALWRTYEKYFKQANEYKDVHVVAMWVGLQGPIFAMKGALDAPAQLKGLKMYGLPGPAAKVLEGAGAGVVAAPAVRSHEIISGGTVDAFAGYSLMDANAFKTLQYAKHIVDVPGGLTSPSFVVFMNKKKWDSLSQPDRDAISKLGGEAFAARSAAYDEIETKVRGEAVAAGTSIGDASPALAAEVMKHAKPLEDAWIADAKAMGVDGAAALAFYRDEAKKNAK
jgi:TRAP-type C4-dicarboxylate transport system substrate-binding protein